ncbi:carbohydrate binding domain-containing protein [Seonamhaeicola marinus]|uniref:Uncharacterized protein n=1 Tax=Seonamhaeicola marinus TaxID=1912246 RepID=A0A5D0IK07_9FLAO|nr:hypothetical protein [Seonamhaeicola marinus]TYA84213.1 hypothetical protein FUA24_06050 [Seonamhaeicola marinus]
MKNLKYLSILFAVSLFFVGCGEDLSVETMDTNHRIIVTSEMDFDNTVSVNGHIDFGDISRGVISRKWTMPGGTDVSVIAENGMSTSTKQVIKGIFYKPGVYDVTLNQTFGGDVYPNDDSTEPINSRVLDTTIVVTVLDSLRASLKLYYINDDNTTGDELVLADGAENEVTASKSVRLTYTAVGEEDNVVWTSNGGKPEMINTTLNEVDMRFNKLGSWDLDFLASRFRPRDADTISFKKIIKVIPSTDPVVLERVYEKAGMVALEFSRDMDPTSLNRNNFSLRLENNGNTINPAISNVILDENENNIVLLELDAERMYDNDLAFVSYAPGNLKTADQVAADAFTDIESIPFNTNIYDSSAFDGGFESTTAASSGGDWPYQGWGGNWGEYDIDINSNNPRTGSQSMDITFRSNGGMIIGGSGNFQLIVGQEYELGYWVYVDADLSNSPTGTATSDIRFYASNWSMADLGISNLNPSFPTGQWVYQKFYFKSTTDAEITWLIRGNNENNADPIRLYLDDMFLAEVELRP